MPPSIPAWRPAHSWSIPQVSLALLPARSRRVLAKSCCQNSPIPTGLTHGLLSSASKRPAIMALCAGHGGKSLLIHSTKDATACCSSRLAGPKRRSQCFSVQTSVPPNPAEPDRHLATFSTTSSASCNTILGTTTNGHRFYHANGLFI